MRADRLVSTLLILQRRGQVTARELAAELEISIATARRDLEALSASGIPVYPQSGRGGGWRLLGSARTDLTGFGANEAEALFLLLGPVLASPGLSDEARSAVRKLAQALPEPFRDDAEIASRATLVEPTRWGLEPPSVQRDLQLLQQCVVRRRVVSIDYRSRTAGATSHRTVEPLGLVDKAGTWYLIANTLDGRRTYRVDRMSEPRATGERFSPPEEFDLAAEWAATSDEIERARSRVWATIEVDQSVADIVRGHFGRYVEDLGDSGTVRRLRVGAHMEVALAEQLAGWGTRVRVIEPPSVQAELARIGAELVAAYR